MVGDQNDLSDTKICLELRTTTTAVVGRSVGDQGDTSDFCLHPLLLTRVRVQVAVSDHDDEQHDHEIAQK